jgi:NAD(P)-dependent dehydrogenase (short-subunit alcohol dehydrogenase family)
MMRFEGKNVVVTGGASGIGRATTHALLAEGAKVAVLDIDLRDLEASDTCLPLTLDVREELSVTGAVNGVIEQWGGIDVLINAAGVELVASVEETSIESWDRVLNINVRGYFLSIRACLPSLRARRGCIVNVASQLALVGASNFAAYTSSKSAVLGLTRSVALETAADGVRVNAVCPGAVDTPLLQRQFADGPGPQGSMDDLIGMHPLGRLGRPDEIAKPILFLASDDASFATGASFVIDGGYTA